MKKICLVLLTLSLSQSIYSHESDESVFDTINNNMLKLNYSFWDGSTISQGDTFVKTGFGGSKELHNIFSEDEMASLHAHKYKVKNRVGYILYFSGLATMTSSLVYSYAIPGEDLNPLAPVSLLGGGFITGMIGAFMIEASSSDLLKAVNAYNENLLMQYKNTH
ncbi:MAG: hypothetical protein JEY91_13740 [Spirochaetaceae bacterium]|nr:hypothetical protein [Spirochaetaceae bacterium]